MTQPAPTLACSGQPGVPKPGLPRLVVVGGTALDALVGLIENPQAALILLPVIAGIQYDLVNLCSKPDPGDPVLTADDIANIANYFDMVAMNQSLARVNQWVQHMLWPVWCDCTDGSSPPPATTAPLPPVGVNTNLPAGPTGPTCWDANLSRPANASGDWNFSDVLPKTQDLAEWTPISGPAPQLLGTPLPTSVTFSGVMGKGSQPSDRFIPVVIFIDAAGQQITLSQLTAPPVNPGGAFSLHGPVPTNAAYIYPVIQHQLQNSGTIEGATGRIELLCGASPYSPVTPCCPPDPALDARLYRIEQLEQVIIKLLGHALVGHVDGTRHSGLSGVGSIVLVDSVDAIRVDVTNSLTGWPNNPGDPNYYFSLGFITSIAAGSPLKGWRLVYSAQTFPIVPYADQIGYTLPPGVTIAITELLPAA